MELLQRPARDFDAHRLASAERQTLSAFGRARDGHSLSARVELWRCVANPRRAHKMQLSQFAPGVRGAVAPPSHDLGHLIIVSPEEQASPAVTNRLCPAR
jgi:hypothetical protein